MWSLLGKEDNEMYIVIYDKITKEIIRVIEKTNKFYCVGYSENYRQAITDIKPEGRYWDN